MSFRDFVKALFHLNPKARVPSKAEYKKLSEKGARKRDVSKKGFNVSRTKHFGTFQPVKPLPQRTDFSSSADAHINRIKSVA